MKMCIFYLLAIVTLVGCLPDKSKLHINMPKKGASVSSSVSSASVSSVQVIDNQLVINGNGFGDVTNVKVNGLSFNEIFSIESKSSTKIIANSIRAFSFDVSKVFSLILSDANASATFAIDFSLCNATLNGKGFSCATAVADKDVLSYDAVSGTWKPRAVSGLNYLGAFNASTNPAAGPAIQPAGAYYIISASGTIAGIPFTTGDWLVSNGSSWQKIDNSTAVLSVFGRSGSVAAQSGDYNLNMLGDVSFPTAPVAGKVLKFDGTNWVAGDDISGGGAGSVTTTEILDGAVTDAKITTLATSKLTGTISSAQIADGTIVNDDINAAALIDYSKINVPDGAIPAVKISGLPVLSTILAASITDGDTTHAPTGEAVYEALLTKLGTGGGTLSVGTISGIPTPVNPSDVANKTYVNSEDALRLLKGGDTMSGVLTLDSDLKVKGGSNYVTIKGSASSTAYDLILPVNDGNANQVLKTDGAGVLAWVDVTDSGVQSFAKSALPTCAAGEVLKSNGTTFSCVTDAGAPAFTGTANRAVATTGAGGSLAVQAVTSTELGYLTGVTSAIQTQLDTKEASLPTGGTTAQYFAGNKTLQTLNTLAVPELTNLYFTQARAIASPLTGVTSTAGTISAADTIVGAFGKLLNTQTDYVSKTGNSTITGTMTINSIVGALKVPGPVNPEDAVPKSYVDGFGQWTKSGSDIYRNGGNVGIGTSTPGSALEVNAPIAAAFNTQFKVTDGTTGGFWSISDGATGAAVYLPTFDFSSTGIAGFGGVIVGQIPDVSDTYVANYGAIALDGRKKTGGALVNSNLLSIRNNGSPVITVKANGNLGIGTTAAVAKLSVEGAGAVGFQMKTTSAGAVDTMNFINDMDATGDFWFAKGASSSAAPAVTDRLMKLTNAGNLEIYGQEINATDNSGVLALKTQATGGTRNEVSMEFYADRANINTASGFLGYESHPDFDLSLKNIKAGKLILGTNDSDKITILSGGEVGFGTSNPQSILHLANNAPYTTYEETDLAQKFFTGVDGGGYWIRQGTTANADLLTVRPSGNVGIGMSTPTYTLHVNGSVAGTGAYNSLSDLRLKQDIKAIPNALEKISALRGVSFNWNKTAHPELKLGDHGELGVIAQEVKKVFPDAVTVDKKTGIMSVAYSMLIAPLIEAVKDLFSDSKILKREIASLKTDNEMKAKKIKKIEEENIEMKKRLDKIEKLLNKSK